MTKKEFEKQAEAIDEVIEGFRKVLERQVSERPQVEQKWKPYIGPIDRFGYVALCTHRTGRC